MSVAVGLARRGRPGRALRRRPGPAPRWLPATLLFWVAPAVVLTALTLGDQPPLTGDAVIQNYPLRVLAGSLLAGGHLPLWDPYLWSGTPLLAGANAGALFPLTALFMALPPLAAWVATQVAIIGTGATGTLLLGRAQGLSRRGATIAGASFGFGAFLLGQLEHTGLAEGTSLLPVLVLSLHLTRARRRGAPALLAVTTALLLATGEPRAMTLGAVAGVVVGLVLLAEPRAGRGRFVVAVTVAVAIGVLVSALSWLPAYAWTKESQRFAADYAFFTSGSLLPAWLLLDWVPYLLGTSSGVWHGFFGTYNLDLIDSYSGLLAIAGTATSLPTLRRRSGLRPAYALLLVGALLALGGETPLGHLLYLVPIYGRERLQSTNIALMALPLAVLAGAGYDAIVAGNLTRRWRAVGAAAVLLPGLAAVTLEIAAPGAFAAVTGSPFGPPVGHPGLLAYLAVSLVLLVAAAALVAGHQRFAPRIRPRVLTVFVAADLLLVIAGQGLSTATTEQVSAHPPAAAAIARLAAGNRFAVYDPFQADGGQRIQAVTPDLNILSGLASIQGYGSIVTSAYDTATGAHLQGSLLPAGLADGVDDRLALGVLLAPGPAFEVPVDSPVAPVQAVGPDATAPAGQVPQPPAELRAGRPVHRYLGSPQPVLQVTATVRGGGTVTLGVQQVDGTVRWLPTARLGAVVAATVPMRPPTVTGSVGVLVRASRPGTVDDLLVSMPGGVYAVDGALAGAVVPGHWVYAGTVAGYAAYRNTRVQPGLRLVGGAGTVTPDGGPWWGDRLTVSTPTGARLVRSVTAARGWQAVLTRPGRRLVVPVRADGLIQTVAVPPGRWRVQFRYTPPAVRAAEALSLAGLALAALAGGLAELSRRRRRGGVVAGR